MTAGPSRIVGALAAALLVAVPSARAVVCRPDVVPAATVIAPYVEVDMAGNVPAATGRTTILAVTNTTAAAKLIQLTVWNAMGEPAITLTEALSGFDMWRVDFSDLLAGRWSAFDTSLAGTALCNTEPSPRRRAPFEWGPDGRSVHSQPPAPFMDPWARGLAMPDKTTLLPPSGCRMPYGDALGASLAPTIVAILQAPLVARAHGGCAGTGTLDQTVTRHSADWLATLSPNPLFFVATVDVVDRCTTRTPLDAAYPAWALTPGEANVLLADVTYVDSAAKHAETVTAVHVEATERRELVGPYQAAIGVEDHREPLPTAFAFRYRDDIAAQSGIDRTTSMVVFKPFTELTPEDGRVRDCGSYTYYAWDEDEHTMARLFDPCMFDPCPRLDIDPNELPLITQLVPVTTDNFDLPDRRGWVMLVLPPSYGPFPDPSPGNPAAAIGTMAAVTVRYQAHYAAGTAASWEPAAVIGNAHCPTTARPNTQPRRHLSGH